MSVCMHMGLDQGEDILQEEKVKPRQEWYVGVR